MTVMKKRKVLFVIESLSGGGAEKVLTTLLRHIDYNRLEVGLLSICDVGVHRSELPSEVIYYTALSSNNHKSLWYKLKYKLVYDWLPIALVHRLIVPHGYDTEVAFVEGYATKLVAKAPNNVRKISWVHIDLVKNHWISRIFKNVMEERRCYDAYNKICCVSETVRSSVVGLYGLTHKSCVLYNVVDIAEIMDKAKVPVLDMDCSRQPGRIRLCSVGRFEEQKAFDRLVRIMERLTVKGFDAELWLIGDGTKRPEIEHYIADNGLGERIKLLGFKHNPYKYMACADIFVCSSIAEGFSTAVSEAIILGLGIVTTDCSGMRELLGDSEYGIITENDEAALEQALENVLKNEHVAELRDMARHRSQLFDIRRNIAAIENVLIENSI